MYLSYYNLHSKPFQISPDPHFLWLSEKHKEALATLKYGILDNKGLILLTGDIGLGKTTLIHALLNSLSTDVITATILDPGLKRLDFVNYIANAFNIEKTFRSKGDFLIHFNRFLNDAYLKKKKVLLIIDEAQRLSNDMLEEVRLLSNLEKQDVKLLNIFLVGQEELNSLLSQKETRALKQRITINYKIEPLTENEIHDYIQYRLKIAGTNKKIFTPSAVQAVFSFSQGCPRLINIICDHALLTGYVKEISTLSADLIHECEEELRLPNQKTSLHTQKKTTPYTPVSRSVQKPAFHTANKTTLQQDPKPVEVANKHRPVVKSSLRINLYKANTYAAPKKKKKRHFLTYVWMLLLLTAAGYLVYTFGKSIDFKQIQNYFIKNNSREISKAIAPFPSKPDPIDQHTQENLDKMAEMVIEKQEAEELFLVLPHKTVIPFEFNSSQMSQLAYKNLDSLAENILKHTNIQVIIKGYTDVSGNSSYNKKISEFRANLVKSYLIGKGIDPLIITSIGIGSENPVDSNTNQSGRKTNRRVEIEIKKLN
jgi:general secretion pathway protein A